MILKYFILGLFVNMTTGFDDLLTRVPIIANVTKTRIGKIAFSVGTLMAIILAIIISIFFATFIKTFTYYRYISAALVFGLAVLIYFDVFVHKPRTRAEKKLLGLKDISIERFTQLMGVGFIASFATVVDDMIAYSPLFLGPIFTRPYAIIGIIFATILQIIAVIYFSEKIERIRYKEEITSVGLVVLGILILVWVI